jgi:Uncharacterized small protein
MAILEDEILQSANMTEHEIRLELAVALFAQQRLSFGQAQKLANLSRPAFEKILFDRGIPSLYDVPEFIEDLNTIHQLRALRHGSGP